MNYFNYFTEIEDEFIRRRGSHLLVSPLDWSLMEAWKQRGIPLHIVLRAINNSFDAYDKRPNRGRKINSLMYCRQEVETCYFDYLEARVGASESSVGAPGADAAEPAEVRPAADDAAPFKTTAIVDYLREQAGLLDERCREAVAGTPLHQLFQRVAERLTGLRDDLAQAATINYEGLENDLTMIEASILNGLRELTDPTTLAGWEKEGKLQLKAYRETMKPEIYQQTLDNFTARKLREKYRVPRLSLFYINP
jgi:hypothetical protein